MSTDLPASLSSILLSELDAPVTAVDTATGTYVSDVAAIVMLRNGTELFVKGSRSNKHRDDYATEAVIGRHLPEQLRTPTLRGSIRQGEWTVLWFDALHASLPHQPWLARHSEAVLEAIEERTPLLTPCPVPNLRALPDMVGSAFRVWQDLTEGRPRAVTPTGLGAWEREHLPALAYWERRWPAAATGTTLCHFDPRADNYLLDDHGLAWTIDWSRGSVGASWIDLVTFLVTLAGDGYDAEQVLRDNPLTSGIDAGSLNSHLAALAGYWTDAVHQIRPDRSIDLLDYQQRSRAGALRWLKHRITRRA